MFVAGKLKKHFFLKTTMTEDAFKIFFKKIAFLTIFGLSSLLKQLTHSCNVIFSVLFMMLYNSSFESVGECAHSIESY